LLNYNNSEKKNHVIIVSPTDILHKNSKIFCFWNYRCHYHINF